MDEFQNEVNEAKKILFDNPIENGYILEQMIMDLNLRVHLKWKPNIDVKNKILDIIYQIQMLKNAYPQISAHDLRTVLELCFNALEERIFFESTVGNIKNFSSAKLYKEIMHYQPFINGAYVIKVPHNPNAIYLDTLSVIKEITPFKESEIVEFLNIVYDKKKKAKIPKIPLDDLLIERDIYKDLVKRNSKSDDLKNHLNKIENLIKTYK